MLQQTPSAPTEIQPGLRKLVAAFETPSIAGSLYQMATSIGLYIAAGAAMYWSLHISYWLTFALMFPAAGLLTRVFIVQHDCGHGSFFASRKLNDVVGRLCSILTFSPYAQWRRHHNEHHRNWNNLDRREDGADIYATCITLNEYKALSAWERFGYRLLRHPIVAHVILPPLVFMVLYRVPFDTPKSWVRERRSVYLTNVALLAFLAVLMTTLGVWQVLLIQIPVLSLSAIIGVALFSVQHRFDGVVWSRQGDWSSIGAAIEGTSYFRLPRLLQWFTGNIGFHHIHHLSTKVANYRLQDCHQSVAALQSVTTISLRESYGALRLTLWDEANGRMVRFKDASGTTPAEIIMTPDGAVTV